MTRTELDNMISLTASSFHSNSILHDEFVSEMWLRTAHLDLDNCNKTYIYRTLKGICLNMIAKEKNCKMKDFSISELDYIDELDLVSIREMINCIIESVDRRERSLLYYRFWCGFSLHEIGLKFNLSAKYCGDIIRQTLKKMKEFYYESR
jgi:RNA polymerase sigma factor (sigma-70 family)